MDWLFPALLVRSRDTRSNSHHAFLLGTGNWATELTTGDATFEGLPTIQELTERVRRNTEHLATLRLTYKTEDASNAARESLVSGMRYSYFSRKAPRCNDYSQGTAEDFQTVFHLVAFEHTLSRSWKNKGCPTARNRRFWKVGCEYEIPASFTLENLADLLSAEVQSQNDFVKLEQKHYSTVFWINGTVYKDERSHVDLGDQLQKYMADATDTCKSPALPMSKTVLRDTPVRLGEPLVFLHEREEPQTLLFSNMLFSSAPPEAYPITLSRKRNRLVKCDACVQNYAHKLTKNSRSAVSEKHWWCKSCFVDFHFDKDGNCLPQDSNFVVYDYE
eukprot:GEMP01008539.1.p1 GENE.GEMP01008539.1~~GEMP01008539.1.p1  ORF type:complete len:332 (+),score=49.23 GEMP01008539.1:137-1132(+)